MVLISEKVIPPTMKMMTVGPAFLAAWLWRRDMENSHNVGRKGLLVHICPILQKSYSV